MARIILVCVQGMNRDPTMAKDQFKVTLEVKVSAMIVFLKLRSLDSLGPMSALWKLFESMFSFHW